MPTISRIRLTNIIYEEGAKRYNDQIFRFDGENGIFLLENGGGKTVFLQTVLQAIIPHADMADRKIKDTLSLDGSPAHIAIEWILNEKPRRYALTAVSLYMESNVLKSLKYTYDYGPNDKNDIEGLPFVIKNKNDKSRPADKGEMSDYYARMKQQHLNASVFTTRKDYHDYIRDEFKIIPNEWHKIGMINSSEGDIESFFEHCKTTEQLINNLLIPIVEDALQGKEKIDFVQTFEKQREHFKQNKRLSVEIEQFKEIKEKVDDYVEQYSKLDTAEVSYAGVRKNAKGFMQFIIDELATTKDAKELIETEYAHYKLDQNDYEHKLMSVGIYELEEELDRISIRQNMLKKEFSKENEVLVNAEQRIQNIEISKFMSRIEDNQEMLESLAEQVAAKEEDEEELEIREKKKAIQHFISGAYIGWLDELKKKKDRVDHQVNRERETLLTLKKTYEDKTEEITSDKGKISGFKASIGEYEGQMDQIQRDIFEPINEENITIYSEQWKKRNAQKESELNNHRKRTKEIETSNSQLIEGLKELRIRKSEADKDKKEKETLLSSLMLEQEKLIEQAETILYDLNIYDTIYVKEESIRNSLADRVERLSNDFEDALMTERISSRLADLYTDVPFFVTDTLVNKKIQQINQQVDYIMHGVEYLEQVIETSGETIETLFEQYPYWASSIVTTEKSKEKVMEFISGLRGEMTTPVYILTTDEAKAIIAGSMTTEKTQTRIFPFAWKDNLETETFTKWKEEILVQASDAKADRQLLHKKLETVQSVYKLSEKFFGMYSHAYYKSLVEATEEYDKLVAHLASEINSNEDLYDKHQQEQKKIMTVVDQLNQEIKDLEQKFAKSLTFIKLTGSKRTKLTNIMDYQQRLARLEKDKMFMKDEINRQDDLLTELRESLTEAKQQLNTVERDALYLEVKKLEPSYSSKGLTVLKKELERVEDQLKGFDTGVRQLQTRMDDINRQVEVDINSLEDKKKTAKYSIERLSLYNDGEIDKLVLKVEKAFEAVKKVQKRLDDSKNEHTRVDTIKEFKMEDLLKRFEVLYVFEESLQTIGESLSKIAKQLTQQKESLDRRLVENEKELTSLGETKQVLEIESVKHRLGDISLDAYSRDLFIDYAYKKDEFLKSMQDKLKEAHTEFEKMVQYIHKRKESYLEFCKSTIKEAKLKDMAIKGIVNKLNYQDLLDYQKNMEAVLNRGIKLAEDDRRESDAELQTFLTHLLSYSRNVLEELNAIQNKTRIKVDGVYKQIFIFNIPKWDELEAKESLRRYIDHIVSAYDAEEAESEDKEGLRQFIETKLNVKNLIMRTLGDKSIKIKCRKVTNDLKINQAPLTWESSNKWSGGEKWSKNMTLFLSLLNYLAEKKQYLSVEQKRHRTVILDNPFGKASSKHVLDPVFFIAENLGFQMITVTAHAEGKFVTDYFPIVYSGKLRASSDPSKQIMDMERSLNTVYLKTESPDSLLRFEESEQLSFLK